MGSDPESAHEGRVWHTTIEWSTGLDGRAGGRTFQGGLTARESLDRFRIGSCEAVIRFIQSDSLMSEGKRLAKYLLRQSGEIQQGMDVHVRGRHATRLAFLVSLSLA